MFEEIDCRLFGCGGVIPLDREISNEGWLDIITLMKETPKCDKFHNTSSVRWALREFPEEFHLRGAKPITETETALKHWKSPRLRRMTSNELEKGILATATTWKDYVPSWAPKGPP